MYFKQKLFTVNKFSCISYYVKKMQLDMLNLFVYWKKTKLVSDFLSYALSNIANTFLAFPT
jgi:hypothetical protein